MFGEIIIPYCAWDVIFPKPVLVSLSKVICLNKKMVYKRIWTISISDGPFIY